jgi:peptidoglycan-N-acetylglucosamine deacetylase
MKKAFIFIVVLLCSRGSAFCGEYGRLYTDGPKARKAISLTFDDGPGPQTQNFLELLAKYDVKATFFMLGCNVVQYSGLVKKVDAAGHEIGSHTYGHVNFFAYKKPDIKEKLLSEITKAEKAEENILGRRPVLLRLPYGFSRKLAREAAKEKKYYLVNWTFGCDWNNMTSEQITSAYIKHIAPGAIFLMHDGGKNRAKTLAAAEQVIIEAKKRGYEIIPVGALLGLNER